MDNASDEVVTLWDAFYRLEPWGGEYQRHAAESELLEHIFAMLANRNLPPNRRDLIYRPRRRRAFFPPDYAGEVLKTKRKGTGIAEQCQQYVAEVMRQARK